MACVGRQSSRPEKLPRTLGGLEGGTCESRHVKSPCCLGAENSCELHGLRPALRRPAGKADHQSSLKHTLVSTVRFDTKEKRRLIILELERRIGYQSFVARQTQCWLPCGIRDCFRTLTLPAALLLIFCATAVRAHADDGSASSRDLPSVKVALERQNAVYSLLNNYLSLTRQNSPFKNEPMSSGTVIRGALNFGAGAGNTIPFIWQRDARRLFLDLKHDESFTNAAGAFSARADGEINFQTFTSVPLVLATSSGRCSILADLIFWDFGDRPSCSVALHTFWQGKATLRGQDWQVGIIPAIPVEMVDVAAASREFHLLLRPWEKRHEPVNVNGNTLEVIPFAQKIFFGGHAYLLNLPKNSAEAEIKPVLEFAEQPAALGELKIAGKYLQRMTLPGDAYFVILDRPAEMVKIPAGKYNQPGVLLEQNGARASLTPNSWQTRMSFSVNEKSPATLVVGGPLTNSVSVSRHGKNLRLDYSLVGVGGINYQLATQDSSHPPGFAIYKGDKKIASGNFDFG